MKKRFLKWLLKWVIRRHANSGEYNASQIVDCALYLKENLK